MRGTRHIAVVFLLFINVQDVFGSEEEGIHTQDRRLLLNDPQTLLTQIEALQRETQTMKTEMNTMRTQVTTQQTQIHSLENKRHEDGITGGKPHHEPGGGVNTLCLPHDPDNASHNFPTSLQSAAHVYGDEYEFTYGNIARDDDVPCAVCHLQSATSVLMIPAKTTCPSGWTMQYHGYLVTDNDDSGWHVTDFISLHGDPEYLTEGARQHNLNGHVLYPVAAVCGSLPCPPYKSGQYITCVVCSL
ncbi:uncharacterized protein LOC125662613 [Ostrea edulis]|uniref:uncharacterized protein LOC125662613 n=1 Tax=Ostrea edulis TaxID=37623 RepID=UPI0024AED16A|nr:uncharacterized protein LOC125662613 [Ostrea edulis]